MVARQKIIFSLVFLICLLIQIAPLVKSGLNYDFGIGFWGAMGHDGIWHLSLTSFIHNPFSITLPMFHGLKLQGYHPLYNLLIAAIHHLSHIPVNYLIFQVFPIFSAVVFSYLSFSLGKKLTQSFSGGILLLLLNTLNNSLGWIVTLIRSGQLSGESLFWSMQSPSNQINPPFQLSLILLLILAHLLYDYWHQPQPRFTSGLVLFLILTLLPVTKVYSAPFAFALVASLAAFEWYTYQRKFLVKVLSFSLISAILVFAIYNQNSSGLISLHPFWFTNSLIESADRLYLPQLANARYTLESAGGFSPRWWTIELFCLATFIVGNFAWRLIFLFQNPLKLPLFDWFLLSQIVLSILIPTLFIQQGTSWNTIQFLYYGLFIANIAQLLYLARLPKGPVRSLIVTVMILVNLPPLVGSLPQYLDKTPPTAISQAELAALTFLSQQPPGIVLTLPYDPYSKSAFTTTPLPLYTYTTTSYVSAYSLHPTLIEDEMNLSNSGVNYQSLLADSQKFFQQKNIYQDRGFLVNNQIDYIYLPESTAKDFPLDTKNLYLKSIYQQPGGTIYQVLR